MDGMTPTRTLTLAEFLLARIAEDEARYTRDPSDYGYGHDFRLAECEAKRRIVELHHPLDGGSPENYPFPSHITGKLLYAECAECGYSSVEYCPTLRLLALPYADHPDYREEWQPA